MAANKLRQRVICITGMARSGTSMVAKILNIMGLYLGPEESLILETDYNVNGCWEHKRLLEISNEITSSIGWHGLQAPIGRSQVSLRWKMRCVPSSQGILPEWIFGGGKTTDAV
jgi:hypothetical protein